MKCEKGNANPVKEIECRERERERGKERTQNFGSLFAGSFVLRNGKILQREEREKVQVVEAEIVFSLKHIRCGPQFIHHTVSVSGKSDTLSSRTFNIKASRAEETNIRQVLLFSSTFVDCFTHFVFLSFSPFNFHV